MASTFTPNIGLEEPARGDYVGTWDTPVNANMTLIDKRLGGTTTVNVSAGSVVLSAAQFQSARLIFSSTLLANVTITFPTSFVGPYTVEHRATGSSAFTITLATTTAGGNYIGVKPGTPADVYNDGSSILYRNLEAIGTYVDFAGSSVPNWITACALPPYLNCDGTSFSSGNYPFLATQLGGTTLPDSKGRARYALDQSAGRLSSAVAGFSPNTVGAGGGSQNLQAHSHNISISDPGHVHTQTQNSAAVNTANFQDTAHFAAGPNNGSVQGSLNTGSATTGITASASTAGTGTANNVPPAYIGGITMIRAG